MWSKRDLQILAQGMAVGGKFNLSSVAGYKPLVWNDEGEYSYFYMNFQKPLADFSPAQFMECVMVQGNEGLLEITDAVKISDMVVKVSCDIDGQTSGIQVYGRASSWLMFANGRSVPEFTVMFTVAGLPTTIALAYVYDSVLVPPTVGSVTEDVFFEHAVYVQSDVLDTILLPTMAFTFSEDVLITYS